MSSLQQPNGTLPSTSPDYYSSSNTTLDIRAKFSDVDDRETYSRCREKLKDAETYNFVNDVWSDNAWCAVNLDGAEIESLLDAENRERPSDLELRWINLWGGDQKENAAAVKAVAAHYGLGLRLTSLMCSGAVSSPVVNSASSVNGTKIDSTSMPIEKDSDVENPATVPVHKLARQQAHIDMSRMKNQFGQLVNDIWHWCSVDWGKRFLCLGYNSLFAIEGIEFENGPNKPGGKRIWSWLILCDDGTVVSVHENPFPSSIPDSKVLKAVRENVLNVLHHLSRVGNEDEQAGSLVKVQIRNFDKRPQQESSSSPMELASLLLYYLFDDWKTTYKLVARKDNGFGEKLEILRDGMTKRAKVELVDDLHQIGRRLAVLKRVYQSYELMINRVLQRQRALKDEARRETRNPPQIRAMNIPGDLEDQLHTPGMIRSSTFAMLPTSEADSLGVRLSSTAIVRFERLYDRIRLYALSEIEECLTEKEALVFMV